jgi:O-antigen/teichoic acid export membrane protein
MSVRAGDRTEPSARRWRTDTFVAVATVLANLLGYGFNLVMSHSLGPSRFGELSALLAVALVAAVPGTAVQALIARRIAARPDEPADDGRLLRQALLLAVGVGLLLLAVSPVLRLFLHVGSWASLAWLAALLVPTTAAFGCQGVLQGHNRFHALGVLLVLVQAARLAAGGLAAAGHGGVATALAATTLLTAVVVVVAVPLTARPEWRGPGARMLVTLSRDAFAVLGVLVLTNLDLLLARHYLPHAEAGLYAAGNLVTKAAFWGPSFVATVTYPRLTQPHGRARTLRQGVSVLGALSLIGIAAAAVGAPLVPVLIGQAYEPIADTAWLFAVQGAALAFVLLGVYAGLAIHDRRLSVLIWAVTVAESVCIVFWLHRSVMQILTTVVIGSLVLVLAAGLLEGRELTRKAVAAEPTG